MVIIYENSRSVLEMIVKVEQGVGCVTCSIMHIQLVMKNVPKYFFCSSVKYKNN